MSTIKEHLIEHIEAYAIAKVTNNSILLSLSATSLKQLVEKLDIKEPVDKSEEVSASAPFDGGDFSTPQNSRPARSRKSV